MTHNEIATMGRIVLYNHPGSADGKYPPIQSPAVVMNAYTTAVDAEDPQKGNHTICDLFVMSNTGGIFFAKNIPEGKALTPSTWSWPVRE